MPDRSGAALPPLREVIAKWGLAARKSLGQHFLLDLNLTRRIVRAAGNLSGATVLEIGPGPGGLTRALLESEAARVIAVERDQRCIQALGDLAAAYPGRLEIVDADALDIDVASLGTPPRQIVANLPYNISTRLLLNWLAAGGAISGMTLMFQREVAERLVARPETKAYGRLSVQAQWRCEVALLFNIPATAFVPPPKIVSTLVRLVPRSAPLYPADPKALETVLAAAFGQRRKMLRSSLKALASDSAALCRAADIEPTKRAENLDVEAFCALARAYAALGTGAGPKR